MSTVAEIFSAIKTLSSQEQDEVKVYLRQYNQSLSQDETPPNVREKLAEAARGSFQPGNSRVEKVPPSGVADFHIQ
jgi:hypothetical protein